MVCDGLKLTRMDLLLLSLGFLNLIDSIPKNKHLEEDICVCTKFVGVEEPLVDKNQDLESFP